MRILCLGAAMSYSTLLFKHVVTSGAIAAHVLGDGRRRGLVRGSPGLIRILTSQRADEVSDISARHSGLCLFVFLS